MAAQRLRAEECVRDDDFNGGVATDRPPVNTCARVRSARLHQRAFERGTARAVDLARAGSPLLDARRANPVTTATQVSAIHYAYMAFEALLPETQLYLIKFSAM